MTQSTPVPTIKKRSSGVLLHISSLPGYGPIGDAGPGAYAFVDLLAELKQSWWQMLPVNPIGAGFSPYSTVCSFAGEPLFIDLLDLQNRGLLRPKEMPKRHKNTARVNYEKARQQKLPLLRLAASRFDAKDPDFQKFCQSNPWLETFAEFMVLADLHKTQLWSNWPVEYRQRQVAALATLKQKFSEDFHFYRVTQFLFDQQWSALKSYANQKGVALIGDIPIFVSFESSDVWGAQSMFCIDEKGKQAVVAGVPPDYFNANGQKWGNALYRWDSMKKDGFKWWLARFEKMLQLFDIVRIDHFIGFHRYWEIPASAKNAKTGQWKYAPGTELFAAAKKKFGMPLPLIAEDLGLLTPEVTELRLRFELPSMKILQFGFANDGGGASHRAHNFDENCVVYTGTHDNETTSGWYRHAKKTRHNKKRSFDFDKIEAYLDADAKTVCSKLIDIGMQSKARLAIFPWQDILALDGSTRMNIPGTADGNWTWRFLPKDVKAKHLKRFKAQTVSSDRA